MEFEFDGGDYEKSNSVGGEEKSKTSSSSATDVSLVSSKSGRSATISTGRRRRRRINAASSPPRKRHATASASSERTISFDSTSGSGSIATCSTNLTVTGPLSPPVADSNSRSTAGRFLSPQDEATIATQSSSDSSPLLIVRGAGTAAVQDAGTQQMSRDECHFLCSSTIPSAKTPLDALEAALELLRLLSDRHNRATLWSQSSTTRTSGTDKHAEQNLLLDHVLDALAFLSSHSSSGKASTNDTENDSLPSSSSCMKAPSLRTQSARRKDRLQQLTGAGLLGSIDEKRPTSNGRKRGPKRWHKNHPQQVVLKSKEWKQVVVMIAYYLSWDCTLSSKHSCSTLQQPTSKALLDSKKEQRRSIVLARRQRKSILQNTESLQGLVRLLLLESDSSAAEREPLLGSPIRKKKAPSLEERSTCSKQAPPSAESSQNSNADCHSSLASKIIHTSVVESVSTMASPQRTAGAGDPTASGRRRRRQKRTLPSVAENTAAYGTDDEGTVASVGSRTSRCSKATDRLSFFSADKKTGEYCPAFPVDPLITSISAKMTKTVEDLRSRIVVNHHEESKVEGLQTEEDPWVSLVCLESLCRILRGKDEAEGGQSCLEDCEDDKKESRSELDTFGNEEEDGSDWSVEEEMENPILQTNFWLGKSGSLRLFARAMSDTLDATTDLLDGEDVSANHWTYWHAKLCMLSSIVDEACLFNKDNRKEFCENDSLSFAVDNADGLVSKILGFIHGYSRHLVPKHNMSAVNRTIETASGTLLLVLRTLTSLTHDNEVAVEQIRAFQVAGHSTGVNNGTGMATLATAVYRLEEGFGSTLTTLSSKSDNEHDLHRYDCTIFCLNTLANISTGLDMRGILVDIKVTLANDQDSKCWLQWLCQWLLRQTESFHDQILGVDSGSAAESKRELSNSEDERLVAAGNGFVLLACLMVEPEQAYEEDTETIETLRSLIIDEMPKNKDGSSTGVRMIVNTLKAFCNFYHYSLGELSVAIVTPVKQLLKSLQEM